jgi:hypothetical protein
MPALLNYTTSISAEKTVAEIQRLLLDAGARSIRVDYDARRPVGLAFTIRAAQGDTSYRLPVRIAGVLRLLEAASNEYVGKGMSRRRRIATTQVNDAQAARVAWRQVKDWLEAQLAMIAAEMVGLDEVFMPYEVVALPDGGEVPLFEAWRQRKSLPGSGVSGRV